MRTTKKANLKTISAQKSSIKLRPKKSAGAELEAAMKAFKKGCKRYENAARELDKF